MNDTNQIPVVNIFGPGSQPEETEGQLEYMPMPADMQTFAAPILPEPEELDDVSKGLELLNQVKEALVQYQQQGDEAIFDLTDLSRADIHLINQMLGMGEVSIIVDTLAPMEIQESILAGVWRIHHLDANKKVIKDCIEVASIPSCVYTLAFADAQSEIDTNTDNIAGLINSPSLLVELNDKVVNYNEQEPVHVVNLSLLPISPDDLNLLGARLGVGPITILSRGYGNCRIGSTACKSVWWIKYFNSEDALILNTIEVTNMPDVAVASAEDIADSAHRLAEILQVYL